MIVNRVKVKFEFFIFQLYHYRISRKVNIRYVGYKVSIVYNLIYKSLVEKNLIIFSVSIEKYRKFETIDLVNKIDNKIAETCDSPSYSLSNFLLIGTSDRVSSLSSGPSRPGSSLHRCLLALRPGQQRSSPRRHSLESSSAYVHRHDFRRESGTRSSRFQQRKGGGERFRPMNFLTFSKTSHCSRGKDLRFQI